MERIVNSERWRGPSRIIVFVFSAMLLMFALMHDSRNPNPETNQNVFLHFLPIVALFALCVFANLLMPVWQKTYLHAVEIKPSKLTITLHHARTIWQRATVTYFELPITAIESKKLVFQDFGESPNQPHLSLSMHDAPTGCPKNIVLRATKEQVSRFINIADTQVTHNLIHPPSFG